MLGAPTIGLFFLTLVACGDKDTNTDDTTETTETSPTDTGTSTTDADADGYTEGEDCDDTDADINPDAEEVPYDGVDNDCDEATPDDDLDGDGVVAADDCDDSDPTLALDVDDDNDGFTTCDGDCNDEDPDIWPGAPELCDGIDNNCDSGLDDEEGIASFVNASGDWTDMSAELSGTETAPASLTLSEDGALHLCSGEWIAALHIEAEVSVVGSGPEQTALSGGSAVTVIDVAPGASASLSGLTLHSGEASMPSTWGASTYLSGGGVFCVAAALTLEDVSITDSSAELGGALFAEGCEISLNNTTIKGNSALYGGGMYLVENNASIHGVSVFNNTASVAGGGLLISESLDLNISDTTVDSNSAEQGGGACIQLSHFSSTSGISDSSFSNNTADRGGGGLFIATSYNLSISDTTINNNSSPLSGGGALVYLAENLKLSNTTIDSNSSSSSGGGFYINDSHGVSIEDSTFSNNTTPGSGGGLYLNWSNAAISTSDFLKNSSDDTFEQSTRDSDVWGLSASFECSDDGTGCN